MSIFTLERSVLNWLLHNMDWHTICAPLHQKQAHYATVYYTLFKKTSSTNLPITQELREHISKMCFWPPHFELGHKNKVMWPLHNRTGYCEVSSNHNMFVMRCRTVINSFWCSISPTLDTSAHHEISCMRSTNRSNRFEDNRHYWFEKLLECFCLFQYIPVSFNDKHMSSSFVCQADDRCRLMGAYTHTHTTSKSFTSHPHTHTFHP